MKPGNVPWASKKALALCVLFLCGLAVGSWAIQAALGAGLSTSPNECGVRRPSHSASLSLRSTHPAFSVVPGTLSAVRTTLSFGLFDLREPQTSTEPAAAGLADVVARAGGFPGGIGVVLGRSDAELPVRLAEHGRLVVHALLDDAALLPAVRDEIRSRGVYGVVSAEAAQYDPLPYAENLVNLLVADQYPALRSKGLSAEEVFRVLCPLGVATLGDSAAADSDPAWVAPLRAELERVGFDRVEIIRRSGTWVKATKPWPPNIDQWTHFLHGPDGNPVADDTVVGPPRHYQWTAGPMWLRAHDTDSSVSAVVTSRGRLYYIVDEAPISLPGNHPLPDKWFLAARDAFNGVLLWKVPIQHWGWREWKQSWFLARPGDIPLNLEMRLVAADDRLYVTLGYRAPVSQLDAKTGRTIQTYPGTEGAREILHQHGTLILTVPAAPKALPAKVIALEAETGKRLWETDRAFRGTTTDYIRWKEAHGGIEPPVLDPALNPASDGRVVALIDGGDVVGLDFQTGQETWRTTIPNEKQDLWMGAMIVHDGVVVYASQTQVVGLSAAGGEVLWSQPKAHLGHLWYEWKDVFVIDGLVWTYSASLERGEFGRNRTNWPVSVNGYDLHTGALRREVPLGGIFKTYHHHRCYRAKATVRYILASRRGTEYIDLAEGHHTVDNWVRGTCHFGMLPANGLQYAPPHPCRCYILEKLNGFNALAPEIPAKYRRQPQEEKERLEKGPAYGAGAGPVAGPADWPTFRHDAMRSGATQAEIGENARLLWDVKLGGKVSAPIVVGDRVFAALIDEHQVVALNANDGTTLWRCYAGARVDSPPTYWRGTLLFGSADGWVYCVGASDGALRWRFRAAPEDRRIGAFGQLESAWPVHGSVLVIDGRAYFAAGRSSHLDGGIRLYALDAASGKVIHRTTLEGPSYTVENIATNYGLPQGALSDILLGDGQFIYMRGYRFSHELTGQTQGRVPFGALGGFLDDTYFQRAYWYAGSPANFARLITIGSTTRYLVRMFDQIRALDPEHYFTPGQKGYLLMAQEPAGLKLRWSTRLPVRVRAMVLAGRRLFAAGPPDVVDPEDPLGAFEGRKGAVLDVFDARSGEKLSECRLASPPVFNGAAAGGGRLYLTTEAGTLACLGED